LAGAHSDSAPKMNLDGCHALITGASAGIGYEFARQLAVRAASLVLAARRKERLEELRDQLNKQNPSLKIEVRQVDLSDQMQVEAFSEWIKREHIEIDLLINNAGLGDSGSFATSDVARLKEMMQVNMVAVTMLTRRLLPQMIARKRGAILNVSSSAGFLPIPGTAVYAASKTYVTSLSEALRTELRGSGVSVTALCPGPVHTEFSDVAQRPNTRGEKSPEIAHVSVERVVRDGLAAVERDRPIVIPGFLMKLGMTLVRLTPMPVLRTVMRSR
jgi:short-subunit dehydrogenase